MRSLNRSRIPRLFLFRIISVFAFFIFLVLYILYKPISNISVPKLNQPGVNSTRNSEVEDSPVLDILDTKLIHSKSDLDLYLRSLGDIPISDDLNSKRDFVKKMMKSCWYAYADVAFGHNEVNVKEKKPYNNQIFGSIRGITIVDSIDTLFLFGMYEEYNAAKEWITMFLDFPLGAAVNLFENNIRVFGGLLSAYSLTSDNVFLEKAKLFGKRTITSFTNIFPPPWIIFNIEAQKIPSDSNNLAEIGTLYLEYALLTSFTNDEIYFEKVFKIRKTFEQIFNKRNKPLGTIYRTDGSQSDEFYSIGSRSDSFYEYLLKGYVLNKTDEDSLNFFIRSIDRLNEFILKVTPDNRTYYGSYGNKFNSNMEHLSCFTGGMYALASINVKDVKLSKKYLELAKSITETCYASCVNTITGLCPEQFDPNYIDNEKYKTVYQPYILRPELMESLFYLYRVTGDSIYQEKGWKLINNIYQHTKVDGLGHSSVSDVNQIPTFKTGIQESFFMAETLKYAYLLFSSNKFMDIDEWVFNTEAHPFKIYKTLE